jgi:hypothetical protein
MKRLGLFVVVPVIIVAASGCATELVRQSERVLHRIVIFTDDSRIGRRVEGAMRDLGYVWVSVDGAPNDTLNVKWGTAPDWMVWEVANAAARAVGESVERFRGLRILDDGDRDLYVNVPSRAYRAVAAQKAARDADGSEPEPRAAAKPEAAPIKSAGAKGKKSKSRKRVSAPVGAPAAPAATTTTGPFEHHEPGE